MPHTRNLYGQVVDISFTYLGPVADRFISRQITNHFQKQPDALRKSDLSELIDWIKLSMSFLTEDQNRIHNYIQALETLQQTSDDTPVLIDNTKHAPSAPIHKQTSLIRQQTTSGNISKVHKRSHINRSETDVLFSSIGEGIIVTDADGKITRVNEMTLAILGVEKSDLVGKWFPDVIVGSYDDGTKIDPLDRPVTKAIVTGQTVNTRTMYRKKDGTLVPVSLTVSPVVHDGKPTGAIELFRDITKDIQTDKMKTDFISVASHQLRTPLSAINIYSRMLNDGMAGDLNEEQLSFVKSILASVDRMNHLITTLLNITRIEAGGVNVKISQVHLHDLAQEILDENSPSAKKRGLQLVNQIDHRTPAVATDALLIKEIYSNLLSNAIKYTPEGGTVTVTLTTQGNNILFSVEDTGFGIPASAQEHIFTKFFRADNILSEDVSGTGLGLYLTKTVAESLNGELWFESEENVGSKFYFSLAKQGSVARAGRFKLEASKQ